MRSEPLLATCWTYSGDVIPHSGARSAWSLAERIEAVADAGFSGIDLDVTDLRYYELAEVKRLLDLNGIEHVQIGTLTNWWLGPSDDARLLFRAAGELGASTIVTAADTDNPQVTSATRDSFWLVAERARSLGARLALEPTGLSNLRTVDEGARFVQAVGHPSGGLLVDFWHVMRGRSTGAGLAAAIDPSYLVAVELCDGPLGVPEGMAVFSDSADNRRLPGDGEWDVTGFIGLIRHLGFQGPWGVEVTSIDFRRLSLVEAVGRASIATRAMLQRTT